MYYDMSALQALSRLGLICAKLQPLYNVVEAARRTIGEVADG